MTIRRADTLTSAQRSKLFALAKEQGHTIDDLRAMTPAGSISMLTRGQAATLIDALEKGNSPNYGRTPRMPRRPAGTIRFMTDAQCSAIDRARARLGMTATQFHDWLAKRHFRSDPSRSMACVLDPKAAVSTADAGEVIELLKAVVAKHEQAVSRRAAENAEVPS